VRRDELVVQAGGTAVERQLVRAIGLTIRVNVLGSSRARLKQSGRAQLAPL
jgi:hypothetical protein